jgi:hypothetical protein
MQRFITILILAAAVPFAIYVWPTKYAYDQIKLGDSQFPVRIQRLTGEADFLTPAGWRPLKPGTAQTDSFGLPVPSPSPITPTPAVRRPANSPTPRQSER